MMPPYLDSIIKDALEEVSPGKGISRLLTRSGNALNTPNQCFALNQNVYLISVGKAASEMTSSLLPFIQDHLQCGYVITKYGHLNGHKFWPTSLIARETAHPVPDYESLIAGKEIHHFISNLPPDSLLIVNVSGGASSLMVCPIEGESLEDIVTLNKSLLSSGNDIRTINTERIRHDQLKGGKLVALNPDITVLGLIVSDVIGDPLGIIASGLTDSPRAFNQIVTGNLAACKAAVLTASKLGYDATLKSTSLCGEASTVGQSLIRDFVQECHRIPHVPKAWIYGGETTVTLPEVCLGIGGRNQELVLAALSELKKIAPVIPGKIYMASLGTDGTDGPTDAAGAWLEYPAVIGSHLEDQLKTHDSYSYFKEHNGLIMTGPTGTNVADIIIALYQPNGMPNDYC